MSGTLTDVPGVRVGHWTGSGTGVTVVVPPEGWLGSCEVRGGAPATRETALLDPSKHVEQVDAIVLAGGSAFGLAAASGVMDALAAAGRGVPTAAGPVPIVPAACIFDLVASGGARPTAADGAAAFDAARPGPFETGAVGAGTAATVGKWRGVEHAVAGGVGTASVRAGDLVVGALAVANAVGDVIDPAGHVLAGSTAPASVGPFPDPLLGPENTTPVVVATNAALTKVECFVLAQAAEVGLVRATQPAVTRYDGDIAFVLAPPPGHVDGVVAHFDRLRILVTEVVAAAVRASVTRV